MKHVTHVMNQPATPAAKRAAEHENLLASQYIGKRVEFDPDDGYGIRRGRVYGHGRYVEGSNRIGALCLSVERDEGPKKGTKFSVVFSADTWKVIE